jgi:hypothetical protein
MDVLVVEGLGSGFLPPEYEVMVSEFESIQEMMHTDPTKESITAKIEALSQLMPENPREPFRAAYQEVIDKGQNILKNLEAYRELFRGMHDAKQNTLPLDRLKSLMERRAQLDKDPDYNELILNLCEKQMRRHMREIQGIIEAREQNDDLIVKIRALREFMKKFAVGTEYCRTLFLYECVWRCARGQG